MLFLPEVVALISTLGAILYYIMPLRWGVVLMVALVAIIGTWFLTRKLPVTNNQLPNNTQIPNFPNHKTILLFIIYYLVSIILLGTLLHYSTAASIRSPWEVVPSFWIISYFIACLLLIYLLGSSKKPLHTTYYVLPTILFFVLSFSVALLVYRVGYGYDQFIHQATERTIFDNGEILPKPPYYLGQYALMVILSKLTFVPVELLDRFFLPIFAGIFLPLIVLWSLRRIISQMASPTDCADKKLSTNYYPLTTILFLAIPFSSFIVTTPQGLANFFFTATILATLPLIVQGKEKPSRTTRLSSPSELAGLNGSSALSSAEPRSHARAESAVLFLEGFSFPLVFSLAAISIHPLAGIPALLFTLVTFGISRGYKRTVILTTILATIALPATLLLSGFATFKIPTSIAWLPSFSWQPHFHALLDISYTYTNNIGWIMVLVSIAAGAYLWRTTPTRHWLIYPVSAAILFINAFLIQHFLIFPAVIGYEQGIFAARVYELARFALIPLLLLAAPTLIARILQHPQRMVKLSWALILAIFITSSMYASYPRVDAYEWSKGYSVSSADQHAVQSIHTDAKNSAYVVLSNQSVSAAAVQAYGFPTSYAIPTSGRLYQLYSDMVYIKPSAQTMGEAMDEANVGIAYFVINQYWTNADKIIEAAKREANSWWEVDEKITIFRYER